MKKPVIARCVKLFSDPGGNSHFEDVYTTLLPTQFVAEAEPLFLSSPTVVDQASFFGASAGWSADWHPSSGRHLFLVISGQWEVESSDGEVRQFSKGDVLLAEDTTGRGHKSRVIGDEESLSLLVRLAD